MLVLTCFYFVFHFSTFMYQSSLDLTLHIVEPLPYLKNLTFCYLRV